MYRATTLSQADLSQRVFVGVETDEQTFGPLPCLANRALQLFQDAATETVSYFAWKKSGR